MLKYDWNHTSSWVSTVNLLHILEHLFLKTPLGGRFYNVISSINSNKASGPNSIPQRILFHLKKNEISKQVGKKTERVIFKSKQNKFEDDSEIKLGGKILYPPESVKYLGVKIDANLSWQYYVTDLSINLNRANALLFKTRKYASLKILRSIYFAIFDSCLSYCCLAWTRNCSTIQRILILPKKAIKIINFQPRNIHTSPLFS